MIAINQSSEIHAKCESLFEPENTNLFEKYFDPLQSMNYKDRFTSIREMKRTEKDKDNKENSKYEEDKIEEDKVF